MEIIPQRSLVLVKYFSVQGLGDSVLLVHAVGNARKSCGSSLMFYWSVVLGLF